MERKLPLEGVRVLDVSHVWGGPHATAFLGELGAEVIKVEPHTGDVMRGVINPIPGTGAYPNGEPGAKPYNRAAAFNQVNKNKLGIAMDFGIEDGTSLFKQLVKISDVVVENFTPGTMDKLGLDYTELQKVKPDIIMLSMSGYGPDGPRARYRIYGVVMEHLAGFSSVTGYPGDSRPMRSGVDHLDPLAGVHAAGAILAALLFRKRTGEGQHIRISFMESGLNFRGPAILDYGFNGHIESFYGNRELFKAPQGAYRCQGKDEWVTISIESEDEWHSLCEIMGNPAWCNQSKFNNSFKRQENHNELDKNISEWTKNKSANWIMRTLQEAGVAAGQVFSIDDLANDPHLKERGFFETVNHPEAGSSVQLGPRAKLSRTPLRIRMPAPCYGQHNHYVFGELLGLSPDDIKEYIDKGVIFQEPGITTRNRSRKKRTG